MNTKHYPLSLWNHKKADPTSNCYGDGSWLEIESREEDSFGWVWICKSCGNPVLYRAYGGR